MTRSRPRPSPAASLPATVVVLQLLVTSTAVVIADQLTKAAAVWASPYSDGAVVPVLNRGSTMVLSGIDLPVAAVLWVAGLATFGRHAWLLTLQGRIPPWVSGLLVGGALSNLADRMAMGAVRDFLATPVVILNVADLAVVAGLGGIVLGGLSGRRPDPDHGSTAAASASAPAGHGVGEIPQPRLEIFPVIGVDDVVGLVVRERMALVPGGDRGQVARRA
jgi:signal peptidase II